VVRDRRSCPSCDAPLRVDAVAIDVVPDRPSPQTLGARAMQSAWIARVYEAWWRPALFAVSTGFGAPSGAAEAEIVLAHLARRTTRDGAWLDLSCGAGTFLRRLSEAGAREARSPPIVGLDLSRSMLERARARAPGAVLVRADAAHLPFADRTFAAVTNLAALDLYEDPARVVAEAARVLVPGGRWIASSFVARTRKDPRAARLFSRISGVRKPTVDELAAWAAAAGLSGFGKRRFRGYVIVWADKP
jgi:SAM-dependent methyltransferase